MKTLKPVSEETYERIGKACVICSQYPDVFNDVTLKRFYSMFVDVVNEDTEPHEVKMKAAASDMRRMLQAAFLSMADAGIDEPLRLEIDECLCHIDGELCPTDE